MKISRMFFMKPNADCSREEVAGAVQDPHALIIDCRTPGETAGGMVTGARELDWLAGAWTEEAVQSLDPAKSYYLYCRSDNRSAQAAKLLRANGFYSVFNAGAYGSIEGL